MNNYLIGIAVVLLLITFPIQQAVEKYNNHKAIIVMKAVDYTIEVAVREGYFTDANQSDLVNRLTGAFADLDTADVEFVSVTETPRYKTELYDEAELVEWTIRVRINNVFAVPALSGITAENNNYYLYFVGKMPSERLAN